MTSTFVDLRQAVVRNMGGNMTTLYDIGMPEDVLASVVNEANHAIEAERDWPWLVTTETITTVAGTRLYTPTAGWYRTKSLAMPDEGPLTYVSLDRLEQCWPTLTDRAQPLWYAEVGGQLDIRPTADAAYALRHVYYRVEPELVDDYDEPLLPDTFRGRIIDMATAAIAVRAKDFGLAQSYAAKDAMWSKRMIDDKRRTKATVGVRSRSGTWDSGY